MATVMCAFCKVPMKTVSLSVDERMKLRIGGMVAFECPKCGVRDYYTREELRKG
jgi:predicted RNA-binding Zn-ribbon protein involved in translation (DUF1610 family)